jgi:hypothetical protein
VAYILAHLLTPGSKANQFHTPFHRGKFGFKYRNNPIRGIH